MKKLISFAAAIIACVAAFEQNPQYDTYFTPDRLRIDLTFAGDASYQKIFLDGMVKEGGWSGSKTNLIDPFRYGVLINTKLFLPSLIISRISRNVLLSIFS